MDAWPVIVAAVWMGTGLITGVWMMRRGHDRRWLVVALVLGPLFVPMALERVERTPRVVPVDDDGAPASRESAPGMRVLVGIDGSPEAERALEVARALMGEGVGQLILAEVVGYDVNETDEPDAVRTSMDHLRRARAISDSAVANVEVLAGPPGEALCRYAADHDIDLVVVGRRGRGLSARVLGSCSDHVVHHSTVPVLVVEPAGGDAPSRA